MDDQRFDALAKRVGTSRRGFLKKAAGLAGVVTVARLGASEAEAARRGYSGPPSPGLKYDARICTLSGCCMECDLFPWTSVTTVRDRLARCVDAQAKICSLCVDDAVADIEGACWAA